MAMIDRLYYPIGYVAERYGIPKSMIRFWIKEFPLDIKQAGPNAEYYFTPDDVLVIGEIYGLVKGRKFTIEGARQEMKPVHPNAMREEIINMLRVF
jgi:DNA-binding transcriptional MerR regulator